MKETQAQKIDEEAADPNKKLSDAERAELRAQAMVLRGEAAALTEKWAVGGTYSAVTTALLGAVSGNVTGTGTQLLQGATAYYLQGLAAREVQRFADGLNSSSARAALQGLTACAGAAAAGGSCASGAAGAAASIVLNDLFDQVNGNTAAKLTPEQKRARADLITTLVGGVSQLTGADAGSARTGVSLTNDAVLGGARAVVKMMQTAVASAQENNGKVKLAALDETARTLLRENGQAVSASGAVAGEIDLSRALEIILVTGERINEGKDGGLDLFAYLSSVVRFVTPQEQRLLSAAQTGAEANYKRLQATAGLRKDTTALAQLGGAYDELTDSSPGTGLSGLLTEYNGGPPSLAEKIIGAPAGLASGAIIGAAEGTVESVQFVTDLVGAGVYQLSGVYGEESSDRIGATVDGVVKALNDPGKIVQAGKDYVTKVSAVFGADPSLAGQMLGEGVGQIVTPGVELGVIVRGLGRPIAAVAPELDIPLQSPVYLKDLDQVKPIAGVAYGNPFDVVSDYVGGGGRRCQV